jgi:hypothetical protein
MEQYCITEEIEYVLLCIKMKYYLKWNRILYTELEKEVTHGTVHHICIKKTYCREGKNVVCRDFNRI